MCKALVPLTGLALVPLTGLEPVAYWLRVLHAFRLFLGGPVRSAPITAAAYTALNGLLIAILTLKLPFVGEPHVHIGILQHFIRDGIVAHCAISSLMIEVRNAPDAMREAFPASGALELLAEAAQRQIRLAEPQPDVALVTFVLVTQCGAP